ncbi:transmembrane protein 163 isoform X4 [Patagioenas fasciata]|uniref:transmembrane protein 163 isoform X4 n=1 Tax=Patagioenas fasciata TaxID=372321 RepID=UPI003A98F557
MKLKATERRHCGFPGSPLLSHWLLQWLHSLSLGKDCLQQYSGLKNTRASNIFRGACNESFKKPYLQGECYIQIPQDIIIYLLGYAQSTVAQDISTLHRKCSIRSICESVIAVSVMRYSASSFGFAFDATLDVLSSAIVLWRYSNAAAVHSAHREYIACVILGVIFLLSSICIVIKAIHDLAKKVLPEVDDFLYSVSVLSGILCTVLAVIKFMLGKVLTSRALITDGFNSLVGGIMGFSILLSAEVFKHNSSVWFLDGSIGVLIGLTIFAYGIKLLIDMIPRVRQTRHYEMFE